MLLQIIFPGVTKYSFHKLLCYLYTDDIPQITTDKCLNLLEVANRLCLPRLINLIECRVVEDLTKISQNDAIEAAKNCLHLLEPVKVSLSDLCDILKGFNTQTSIVSDCISFTATQCTSIGRMVYVPFVH